MITPEQKIEVLELTDRLESVLSGLTTPRYSPTTGLSERHHAVLTKLAHALIMLEADAAEDAGSEASAVEPEGPRAGEPSEPEAPVASEAVKSGDESDTTASTPVEAQPQTSPPPMSGATPGQSAEASSYAAALEAVKKEIPVLTGSPAPLNSDSRATPSGAELRSDVVTAPVDRGDVSFGAQAGATANTPPPELPGGASAPQPVQSLEQLKSGEPVTTQASSASNEGAMIHPARLERLSEVMPNAMVNRELRHHLKIPAESGTKLAEWVADPQLEKVGLKFDPETGSIFGTPTEPGQFKFSLTLTLQAPNGKHFSVRWMADLTINPDPKSLWKNLPSDETDPQWKPDTDVDHVKLKNHVICGASKRGRSHAHEGKFRDDHFELKYLPASGWSILTVADGAGSATLSRHGSLLATRTLIEQLEISIPHNLEPGIEEWAAKLKAGDSAACSSIKNALYHTLADAFFKASKSITSHAKSVARAERDFATTLIAVIHRQTAAGHFVAGFSIGDGGAAILDLASGQLIPLTIADSGEYAGQTRFLAESEFLDPQKTMERIKFHLADQFTAIVAMTDGITDPIFPTDQTFVSFEKWKSFWTENLTPAVDFTKPSAPDDLLNWLDFWSPGNHDDRTIAVLT